jgi:hypothetical protein
MTAGYIVISNLESIGKKPSTIGQQVPHLPNVLVQNLRDWFKQRKADVTIML